MEQKSLPRFLTATQRSLIDREIADKYVQLTPDGFKYVNSSIVIDILNQVFDYAWSWTLLDQGIETCRPYPKHPTVEGSYAWVKGQITAPFTDESGKNVLCNQASSWWQNDYWWCKSTIPSI